MNAIDCAEKCEVPDGVRLDPVPAAAPQLGRCPPLSERWVRALLLGHRAERPVICWLRGHRFANDLSPKRLGDWLPSARCLVCGRLFA